MNNRKRLRTWLPRYRMENYEGGINVETGLGYNLIVKDDSVTVDAEEYVIPGI